jgi:hypothetical protein
MPTSKPWVPACRLKIQASAAAVRNIGTDIQ